MVGYIFGDSDLDSGGGTSLFIYDDGAGLVMEADWSHAVLDPCGHGSDHRLGTDECRGQTLGVVGTSGRAP